MRVTSNHFWQMFFNKTVSKQYLSIQTVYRLITQWDFVGKFFSELSEAKELSKLFKFEQFRKPSYTVTEFLRAAGSIFFLLSSTRVNLANPAQENKRHCSCRRLPELIELRFVKSTPKTQRALLTQKLRDINALRGVAFAGQRDAFKLFGKCGKFKRQNAREKSKDAVVTRIKTRGMTIDIRFCFCKCL